MSKKSTHKSEESVPYGKSKEYRQKYYQKNRERILAGWKEKVECPICHKMSTKNNLPRHNQSAKHQLEELKLKMKKKKQ